MDIIYTNFYLVQIIHNARGLLSGSTCLHIYRAHFLTHPEKNVKIRRWIRGCIYLNINLNFLYLLSNTLLGYITLEKAA